MQTSKPFHTCIPALVPLTKDSNSALVFCYFQPAEHRDRKPSAQPPVFLSREQNFQHPNIAFYFGQHSLQLTRGTGKTRVDQTLYARHLMRCKTRIALQVNGPETSSLHPVAHPSAPATSRPYPRIYKFIAPRRLGAVGLFAAIVVFVRFSLRSRSRTCRRWRQMLLLAVFPMPGKAKQVWNQPQKSTCRRRPPPRHRPVYESWEEECHFWTPPAAGESVPSGRLRCCPPLCLERPSQ